LVVYKSICNCIYQHLFLENGYLLYLIFVVKSNAVQWRTNIKWRRSIWANVYFLKTYDVWLKSWSWRYLKQFKSYCADKHTSKQHKITDYSPENKKNSILKSVKHYHRPMQVITGKIIIPGDGERCWWTRLMRLPRRRRLTTWRSR